VKALLKRWLGIAKSSTADFSELAAATIESLAEAQKAHISDLRVLLDKSAEREAQLMEMVKAVHDARYYRPVVTGKLPENKSTPVIALEHLSDVEVFDEKADTDQIAEQDRKAKELQDELNALVTEQNEQGLHKVEA
jgi:hypothetical protein